MKGNTDQAREGSGNVHSLTAQPFARTHSITLDAHLQSFLMQIEFIRQKMSVIATAHTIPVCVHMIKGNYCLLLLIRK